MRSVVALFDTWAEAQRSVRDLEIVGFGSDVVSVVAQGDALASGQADATAKGTAVGAGLGLLAGLAAVVVPGVGIVAAVGPILASGILGAVGGGLVGSLSDDGVPAEEARNFAEGVRRGGTLVSVRASDDDAPRAIEILNRHRPVNLNERVALWQNEAAIASSPERAPAPGAEHQNLSSRATMGDAADETLDSQPMPFATPAPDLQPTREQWHGNAGGLA